MFFNTFDYNAKGFVDKGADALLSPARYLFRGKNVTVILRSDRSYIDRETNKILHPPLEYKYVHQEPGNRSWLKIALAIVTLIPSLLLGGMVKLGIWACSSRFREVYKHYTPEEANKEIKRIHLVISTNEYMDTKNLFQRHLTERYPEAVFSSEIHDPLLCKEVPKGTEDVPEGTPIFMLRTMSFGAGLFFGFDGEYHSSICDHRKYPYTVVLIPANLDVTPSCLRRPCDWIPKELVRNQPPLANFDYEVYVFRR